MHTWNLFGALPLLHSLGCLEISVGSSCNISLWFPNGALSSRLRDALYESKKSIRCCLPLRSASLDLFVVSPFLMMVSNANSVVAYKI
jgi:hypothetical protein